jgi:hypothetical protein
VRLEVAVHLLALVKLVKRRGRLPRRLPQAVSVVERFRRPIMGVIGGIRQRSWRANVGEEVHPLDQLHRDEPGSPFTDELSELHEVRVPNLRELAELVLQPVEAIRAPVLQGLEGDWHSGVVIEGPVHDAHATASEHTIDPEAARAAEFVT